MPAQWEDLPGLQAAAAVGQSRLMQHWEHAFAPHDRLIGQVLLTHDDVGDRGRFLSARNTLRALLDRGVVPIINENDTVAVEEIKFGDNDQLSALVMSLASADALVILTDVDGVWDEHKVRMPIVRDIERRPGISSVQITFHEELAPHRHAMPPGGFRVAIVNCWDREAGNTARAELRRHFIATAEP